MGDFALAGEGAIWVQKDGPNTEPKYMGCHETGDISEPRGDVKLYYCPDPNQINKRVVSDSGQGAPGLVTTSIATRLRAVKDELDSMVCPGAIYVHHVSCGKPNVFDAYDYTFLLRRPRVTQRTLSKLTARVPDSQDESLKAYEISAESIDDLFKFTLTSVENSQVDSLLDVTSCDAEQCAGDCGDAVRLGTNVYGASGTRSGSPVNMSEVINSDDGGGTWSALAQYPFLAGEVIASIRCMKIDDETTRIIVARGTIDAANPMEIAYSDDGGATWTHVDVGSTNGQYALGPKALFVLDYYNIWLCTSGGYIYFSSDGGASWTAQTSGGLTTQDLRAIEMADEKNGWAVGDSNAILKTTTQDANGQNIWAVVTGPAGQAADNIYSVAVFSQYRCWITYSDNELWYTRDGGDNWSQRTYGAVTGGSVSYISFYDEWVGVLVYNSAASVGTLYVTINGGYTWKALSTPTNAGLNAAIMPTPTLLYAVGNVYSGSAMIIRGSGG